MPIDFLSQQRNAEDATKNLIDSQNVTPDLSGIMSNRQGFLDRVGGQISGMTGLAPSYSQKLPAIDRKLQGLAAKQKFSATRTKYDSQFQNALQRAQNAGLDLRSATEYARKYAEQSSQMEYQANEAQKGRDFSRKENTLKNQYADMGADLQNQYEPDNDYSGALARVLLGTGVGIGTNYLLNKGLANKVNPQPTGGTMFSQLSPYTQGASGRAPDSYGGNLDYSSFSRPGFSGVRG